MQTTDLEKWKYGFPGKRNTETQVVINIYIPTLQMFKAI